MERMGRTDIPVCPIFMENEFKISQRHLPHWQLNDSIYFVTFNKKEGIFKESEQQIIFDHIKNDDSKYYDLFALAVMINHVHLILRPKEGYDLSKIMKGIKGVTARKVNSQNDESRNIWLEESYDRIIRSENDFYEKINYIANNAIKINLVDNIFNYKFFYLKEN